MTKEDQGKNHKINELNDKLLVND